MTGSAIDRGARAKSLVCYGAFEVTRSEGLTELRALGVIYGNGRDQQKNLILVMSKRARVSMHKIELKEFDELDTAAQVMCVNAEVTSAYKLISRDPPHFEWHQPQESR